MTELFHVTERSAWIAALNAGEYRISTRNMSLEEVDFIHCTLHHQLRKVAEYLYGDADDLVVLVIDGARLAVPVRYEAPELGTESYSHIYGAVPIHAVTEIIPVHRDTTGRLVLPE